MDERLTTGEVVLFNPERFRFLEGGKDRLELHELEVAVGRTAGNEAVSTLQIAQRSRDSEPKVVERGELDPRSIRHSRCLRGHGRDSYRFESGSPSTRLKTSRTCWIPIRIRKLEFLP